ncbi:MAG TPA: ABC transporter permease [Galbitalea sp.]|jgi:hypothetical protein
MTTTTATLTPHRLESPHRVVSVTRLLFANPFQILVLPMIILVGVLLTNIAIWVLIKSVANGTVPAFQTGALAYVIVYSIIVGVQAISRTFPFSLGFGVTRRDFYFGSLIAFVILAAMYTVVMTILNLFEIATNGWWLDGHMFTPIFFDAGTVPLQSLLYFVSLLVSLFVGAGVATFYVRWKSTGVVCFFGGLTVLIVAAWAIVTYTHNWPAVFAWLMNTGALEMVAWMLVPAAAIAVAGFFNLRRATPKG